MDSYYFGQTKDEMEAFTKNYNPSSFKTNFTSKYKAAIKSIKDHKQTDNFDYTSQKELIKYYYNAKLVDTDMLTTTLFENLNKLIELNDTKNNDYTAIVNKPIVDYIADDSSKTKHISINGTEVNNIIKKTLQDEVSSATPIFLSPYFQHLILLIFIVRYYSLAILEDIFINGKNNITSIITNTSDINDTKYTNQIQDIVNQIDPEPNLDDEATLDAVTDASQVAAAAEARLASVKTEADATLSASVIEARQREADALAARAVAEANVAQELEANDAAVAEAELALQQERLDDARATVASELAELHADPEAQAAATAAANELAAAHEEVRLTNERLAKERKNVAKTGDRVRGQPGPSILSRLGFGGQSGGTRTSVTDTLLTIGKAANKDNSEVSNLVKYSTNIFYKAITILSLSISIPNIKSNTLNRLFPYIEFKINSQLFQKISGDDTIKDDENIKKFLSDFAQLNSLVNLKICVFNIYGNMVRRDNTPLVTTTKPTGKKTKTSKTERTKTEAGVKPGTAISLGGAHTSDEETARILNGLHFVSTPEERAFAVSLATDAAAATADAAAATAVRATADAATAASGFLAAGVLPAGGISYEAAVMDIIMKGIETTFLNPTNKSIKVKKGGQRTQRNRSKTSGGTRKNMNSIEMDDMDV